MAIEMEKQLERFSTPVLALAGIAILLYLLGLFRLIPDSLNVPMLWVNFLIDFVFLIDLISKIVILRTRYLKSPWFFIDLVSTIPIISSTIELMGAVGPQLQATRAARGTRVARVARVARSARLAKIVNVDQVAKAVREARGQTFLKSGADEDHETPSFNQALLICVPVLLAIFMVFAYYITQQEVDALKASLAQQVEAAATKAQIERIPQYLSPVDALNPLIDKVFLNKKIDDRSAEFAFSIAGAHRRADRVQGLLLVFTLLTVAAVVYMSTSLASDQVEGEEESILLNFLSPSIVETLDTNPEMLERFYSRWLSVFFITARKGTPGDDTGDNDIEVVALQRRHIMDMARNQIVGVHHGIVDKFIGDTVMGWLGGPFSTYWNRVSALRERLALDALEFVDQDIRSLTRELDALENEHDSGTTRADMTQEAVESNLPSGAEERLAYLQSALTGLKAERDTLLAKHQAAKDRTPDLEARHDEAMQHYKQEVATAAVWCCLTIWEEMPQPAQPLPNPVFNSLSIGIASGPVSVGNFGSTDQIGFTVLGETVDRAARLEPTSYRCGCNLLIDLETYELIKESTKLRFRLLPQPPLPGTTEPLVAYEPFKLGAVSDAFLTAFHEGIFATQRHELNAAIEHFERANQLRHGGDAVSQQWQQECECARREGRPIHLTTSYASTT